MKRLVFLATLLMAFALVASAQTSVFVDAGPTFLRNRHAADEPFVGFGVAVQPDKETPLAWTGQYQHVGGGYDALMAGMEYTKLIHPTFQVGATRMPWGQYRPAVAVGADFLRAEFGGRYTLGFGVTATKVQNYPMFFSGTAKLSIRLN